MPGLVRLPPLAEGCSAPLLPSVILCRTVDTVFSPLAFLSCCIVADTCPLPSTDRVNLRTLHHRQEAPSGLLACINSRYLREKAAQCLRLHFTDCVSAPACARNSARSLRHMPDSD